MHEFKEELKEKNYATTAITYPPYPSLHPQITGDNPEERSPSPLLLHPPPSRNLSDPGSSPSPLSRSTSSQSSSGSSSEEAPVAILDVTENSGLNESELVNIFNVDEFIYVC